MKKITGLKLASQTINQAAKSVFLPSRHSQRKAQREVRLNRKYSLFFRPESAMLAPLRKPLAEFAERNEAMMAKRRDVLKGLGMPWAQMHHTIDLFRIVKAAAIALDNKGVCEERAARKLCRFLIKDLNSRIKRERKASGSVARHQQQLSQAQMALLQLGKTEKVIVQNGASADNALRTLLVFHPTGRKNPLYLEVDSSIMALVKSEGEQEIATILGSKKAVVNEALWEFRKKHGLLN